jgi:hypothetical protein
VADPKRALFESVVRVLAPLLDELVFVGGCTAGLFITDSAAGGIRPTKDVDAVVDVMPTDAAVLGFSNRWYPTAIETAQTFHIAGHDVRVVTPALFIATKLEAFHGRGGDDVFASHDLEDIIAVVDGRPEIVNESPPRAADVRGYIGAEMRALLDNRDFTEALAGLLLPDVASQARRGLLEGRLRSMTAG